MFRSRTAEKVLRALQDGPAYGLDLMRKVDTLAGSFYPALDRLEAEGLIEGFWEDGPEPRRRFYRLPPDA
jgi:PadR family transcriptional regulator, regulatory protein PadR